MTEYIERETISEEIRKFYYKNPPNFSYGEGFDRGLDRAQRAILDAQAADVARCNMGSGSITAYRIPYLADVPCAVLLVGQAAFSTAQNAVQRWTDVTVIAIWHEQEQMQID